MNSTPWFSTLRFLKNTLLYAQAECFEAGPRHITQRFTLKKYTNMKKLMFLFVALTAITISYAQPGGGFQRQTPEQRVAAIHAKLDSAFTLGAAKLAPLDTALTVLYKKQDEKMAEMFTGGTRPDRDAMMAERKKWTDARDEMIKAVLSKDQYETWKEKIEPSMRPARPQGQGGGNGGGK